MPTQKTLEKRIELLEAEIKELKKNIVFLKCLATGGIKTNVTYTYKTEQA